MLPWRLFWPISGIQTLFSLVLKYPSLFRPIMGDFFTVVAYSQSTFHKTNCSLSSLFCLESLKERQNTNDFFLILGTFFFIIQHIYMSSINLWLGFRVQNNGHPAIPLWSFWGRTLRFAIWDWLLWYYTSKPRIKIYEWFLNSRILVILSLPQSSSFCHNSQGSCFFSACFAS